MTKFSIDLKNPIFSPFSSFFGHNHYFKKSSCHTHPHIRPWILSKVSEKTNEPIQKTLPDGQMKEKTLIHTTQQAITGGPKIQQL